MKVWVVTTAKEEFLFTDETTADLFCAVHNDCCCDPSDISWAVAHVLVDPEDIQQLNVTKPHYKATIYIDKRTEKITHISTIPTLKPLSGFTKGFSGIFFETYEGVFAVNDMKMMKKFFYDWVAQKKEEEGGSD